MSCDYRCIFRCSGSCATFAQSDALTEGPETDPTSNGYHTPHPSNRIEELESFIIVKEEYE